MTFKEGLLPMGVAFQAAIKRIGCKVPLIIVSVLLLVIVVWESTPPSYASLSAFQVQSFLNRQSLAPESAPQSPENQKNNHEATAPSDVPVFHTDAPGGADEKSSEPIVPKSRPVETVEPDPGLAQQESPVNTTTVVDSSANQTTNANSDVFTEDDTQLVPTNSTTADESTVTDPTNTTSADVFAEEDTQLVDQPAIQRDAHVEGVKYIIPLLSYQVGTGNQLMEYKSAATIARTLNRTLCLIPFFGGPDRHLGYLGNRHSGLIMEDRYDTEVLSKYVKIASMEECVQQCERRLDVHWRLRNSRPPHWDLWFNDTPRFSIDFTRKSGRWSSTKDVAASLGPENQPKCAALGGLFPGLRWRGVMYAASTYMQHSKRIMKAADFFQARALGSNDNSYVSVHWRFEESNCRGHPLGLCFSRCSDGAVIANGRRSETWDNMTLEGRRQNSKNGFNGVFVTREDVSGAIHDRAVLHGFRNVYLSTDGWLRGPESSAILKWVVDDLRSKGLNVAGLWMIGGLPNFADGFYVQSKNIANLFGLDPNEVVSNHMIALVEQELCLRSSVFVGSGQSSWSLAVADTRRGRRCKEEMNEVLKGFNLGTPPEVMEQAVIDKILTIQYTAGPTCRGSFNPTMQKWEDEAPDGWLDYDTCENRLLNGIGQCTRIST